MARYQLSALTAILLVVALSATANAGTILFESLQDGSLPATLTLADTSPARTVTFDTAGASFATPDNDSRNYLRTADTDYSTTSVMAYITMTTQLGTSWLNDSQLFFGIGTGAVGEYGVADRKSEYGVYLVMNNENANGMSIGQMTPSGEADLATAGYSAIADTTQITDTAVKMIYDATAGTIAFDVDYDYAGDATYAVFTADQSIGPVSIGQGVLDDWAASGASSIVFGGDAGDPETGRPGVMTLSNVLITPEPQSVVLLVSALAALAFWRRRQ